MTTKYYADTNTGAYLGACAIADGLDPEEHDMPDAPPNSREVASAPTDYRAVWSGSAWDYSSIMPAPDPTGFEQAVKSAVGGIVAANALATKYPLLHPALMELRWADVQALIIDAHQNAILTDDQYAGFGTLAATYHIPITLS